MLPNGWSDLAGEKKLSKTVERMDMEWMAMMNKKQVQCKEKSTRKLSYAAVNDIHTMVEAEKL